ncbi:tRNA pseudouridine(38-40) synthase TruA [Helicobacter turcicus]|uniref:tRNA pseudouridine synthase A n=1 Tax=Helicobacter turcicus TaxID=2867412 RepID=A0ABS7JN98_9HELI|nr:tRNA pseudouridine(38-40) synthase TruA [Helicobacter turcicus]MBX7490878.1 tRNA pseudouridine(38-40) synthase TruA [Helicobacter turcicus]MBX7545732.1 tRNA pseudouridine(38-40) synthase TruA [Helicobacter turcicus]
MSFKVAMRIAYNGSAFFGFQSQNDVQTVANTLESVFKSVGIFSKIVASGRTDKGVHASAQVISLEIPHFWSNLKELKVRLNAKLASNIRIKRIWQVGDDFHARFSVKRRGYCYVLSKRASPFFMPFSLHYDFQNLDLIKQALQLFVGTHNFVAFKKQGGDEKSNVRTIFRAELREFRDFWILSFWGNGFLRAQVRLIVGFLLEIDRGNLTLEDLRAQLLGEWRYRIPVVANGLFLSRVDY